MLIPGNNVYDTAMRKALCKTKFDTFSDQVTERERSTKSADFYLTGQIEQDLVCSWG